MWSNVFPKTFFEFLFSFSFLLFIEKKKVFFKHAGDCLEEIHPNWCQAPLGPKERSLVDWNATTRMNDIVLPTPSPFVWGFQSHHHLPVIDDLPSISPFRPCQSSQPADSLTLQGWSLPVPPPSWPPSISCWCWQLSLLPLRVKWKSAGLTYPE